jgi:hypothetical protein
VSVAYLHPSAIELVILAEVEAEHAEHPWFEKGQACRSCMLAALRRQTVVVAAPVGATFSVDAGINFQPSRNGFPPVGCPCAICSGRHNGATRG